MDKSYQLKRDSTHEVSVKTPRKKSWDTSSDRSGQGLTREVFFFPKFVVKIGSKANKRELYFWNNILQEADKKHFAKILGHGDTKDGNTFIIQEKVKPVRKKATLADAETWKKLKKKYGLRDIQCRVSTDTYDTYAVFNMYLGKNKGDFKVYDYAQYEGDELLNSALDNGLV